MYLDWAYLLHYFRDFTVYCSYMRVYTEALRPGAGASELCGHAKCGIFDC